MCAKHDMSEVLCFRVVFCGPGCGGKSTALRHIHETMGPAAAGEMISVATDTGRTLFFDFLPVNLGYVPDVGRPVKINIYTAPGQAFYEEARRLVLRQADGVAFIADSDKGRSAANEEALLSLHKMLSGDNGADARIPLVFLYNKRDADNAQTVPELRAALNPAGHPDFEGVATEGKGVFDMLEKLCELVLERHLARVEG